MIGQLSYLGLSVSRLDEWERFATEVLGLQVAAHNDDGSLSLRMDERHHRVIIHPGGRDDVAYMGWEVANGGALRAVTERLRAAGVAVTDGTADEVKARQVRQLIKCVDPNGIPLEISYGARVRNEDPFRSPKPLGGFVTGGQGLGHAVLHVDSFDDSLHFYLDVLGFRVSDFTALEPFPGFEVQVAFLHCNERHHSLAFAQAPAPQRLNHIMLELQSLDDVGRAYYECQDRGVPIAQTLGRHNNDFVVSFYMRSPSGFEIEYGWGGRRIDDATWQVASQRGGSIWGHRRPAQG